MQTILVESLNNQESGMEREREKKRDNIKCAKKG